MLVPAHRPCPRCETLVIELWECDQCSLYVCSRCFDGHECSDYYYIPEKFEGPVGEYNIETDGNPTT